MPMEKLARFILAPLLILVGLWFVAMPFALASMVFGGREQPPTLGEYLAVVFQKGAKPLSWGLLLVISGLLLAAPSKRSPIPGPGIHEHERHQE
jgi:hypothetical protein